MVTKTGGTAIETVHTADRYNLEEPFHLQYSVRQYHDTKIYRGRGSKAK
jgi:hypothetical protein